MDANPYGAPAGDLKGEPENPGSPVMAVFFGIGILIVGPMLLGFLLEMLTSVLEIRMDEIRGVFEMATDPVCTFAACYACARVAKRLEYRCGMLVIMSIFVINVFSYFLRGSWGSDLILVDSICVVTGLVGVIAGTMRSRQLRRQNA